MTLLTMCQDAADEMQLTRPATIIGSSAPDSQRFARYANKVGRTLMKRHPWQALRNEQAFTGVSGSEQTGAIPTDFDRFIAETFWNRSTDRLVVGPISPVRWQGLKASSYTDTQQLFIYRGSNVYFVPDLSGGESLAFEYVSNKWALAASDSTPQTSFLADGDTTLLDEELITLGIIYEWLRSEGQPFQMALADYASRYDTLVANDQPTGGTVAAADIFAQGSRRFTGNPQSNNTDLFY